MLIATLAMPRGQKRQVGTLRSWKGGIPRTPLSWGSASGCETLRNRMGHPPLECEFDISMTTSRFTEIVKIRGVNPFIFVFHLRRHPGECHQAGWRKPLPVLLRVNGKPAKAWRINLMPVGDGTSTPQRKKQERRRPSFRTIQRWIMALFTPDIPLTALSCFRSWYTGLCGSNEALDVDGAAPYLRGDHDPGDSAHEHGNSNKRSDRPDRTGGPLCENQYAQQQVGSGIQEKPSPTIHGP
jgi:hypothetical protein